MIRKVNAKKCINSDLYHTHTHTHVHVIKFVNASHTCIGNYYHYSLEKIRYR